MKITIMNKFLAILLLSIALASPVFADSTDDATEVYTDAVRPASTQEKPSDFHGLLGVALFNGQKIIGDEGRRTSLFPLILLRYKDIAYWSIGGGGVWLLQSDDHALRFGAGIKFAGGWESGDDPELAGMQKRKSSVEGYLNGVWRTQLVTVGLHLYHDIGDASRSNMASLRLSRPIRVGDNARITQSIGATWQDNDRVDYYYGVRPDEALPSRPAYVGRETINLNAGVTGGYRLTRSWSLLGGVFRTRYGNSIVDSPIVERRYATTVFFGTGWRF